MHLYSWNSVSVLKYMMPVAAGKTSKRGQIKIDRKVLLSTNECCSKTDMLLKTEATFILTLLT